MSDLGESDPAMLAALELSRKAMEEEAQEKDDQQQDVEAAEEVVLSEEGNQDAPTRGEMKTKVDTELLVDTDDEEVQQRTFTRKLSQTSSESSKRRKTTESAVLEVDVEPRTEKEDSKSLSIPKNWLNKRKPTKVKQSEVAKPDDKDHKPLVPRKKKGATSTVQEPAKSLIANMAPQQLPTVPLAQPAPALQQSNPGQPNRPARTAPPVVIDIPPDLNPGSNPPLENPQSSKPQTTSRRSYTPPPVKRSSAPVMSLLMSLCSKHEKHFRVTPEAAVRMNGSFIEEKEPLDFFDLDDKGEILMDPPKPMFPEEFPRGVTEMPLHWWGIQEPALGEGKLRTTPVAKDRREGLPPTARAQGAPRFDQPPQGAPRFEHKPQQSAPRFDPVPPQGPPRFDPVSQSASRFDGPPTRLDAPPPVGGPQQVPPGAPRFEQPPRLDQRPLFDAPFDSRQQFPQQDRRPPGPQSFNHGPRGPPFNGRPAFDGRQDRDVHENRPRQDRPPFRGHPRDDRRNWGPRR